MDPIHASLLALRGDQRERNFRYAMNWAYYKAEEYLGYLGQRYAQEQKLFKAMRRVFGYVTQVVDTDARFVMKQRLGVETETDFEEDILSVWERSNFQTEKYKLVRFGSNLGDAYLIAQNIGKGSAIVPRIVVANSEDMDITKDPDDQTQVIKATQEYIFFDEDGEAHRRKWVYWPDKIERYTDDRMDEGYPVGHPFGEVPVIHIPCIDIGEQYGLCSWHNCQGQFDEVNQLGSYMNRILLRYADPTLIGKGMLPGGTQKPVIQKGIDGDNIYFLPENGELSILEYQGSVLSDIVSQIDHIADNIKDQLPELSLSKIREQSGLSGYAVSLHAADFIAKTEELRGNFANGIEWINSLCLRAIRRSKAPLEDFANRVVYEPVFPEDQEARLRSEETEVRIGIVSRRELLRRRGLTEKQIDERLQEVDDDRSAQGFGLGRLESLFGEGGTGETGEAGSEGAE